MSSLLDLELELDLEVEVLVLCMQYALYHAIRFQSLPRLKKMSFNMDDQQEQNIEKLGRELKYLQETVRSLDTRVQKIQLLLQQAASTLQR